MNSKYQSFGLEDVSAIFTMILSVQIIIFVLILLCQNSFELVKHCSEFNSQLDDLHNNYAD